MGMLHVFYVQSHGDVKTATGMTGLVLFMKIDLLTLSYMYIYQYVCAIMRIYGDAYHDGPLDTSD